MKKVVDRSGKRTDPMSLPCPRRDRRDDPDLVGSTEVRVKEQLSPDRRDGSDLVGSTEVRVKGQLSPDRRDNVP